MATSFERVYDKFFLQIGDDAKFKIINMPEKDREDYLCALLEESIVYFKKCKTNLKKRNLILKQFEDDLEDEEISILAYGMVLVWVRPQVMRLQHLKQSLGDRDFKISSNWQTLNSLTSLEDSIKKELKLRISDYTYNFLSDVKIKK